MYLGLDLGTSGLKGLLIDESQHIIADVTVGLSVSRPAEGWSEQDPDSWIEACKSVFGQLSRAHGGKLSAVRAIGLSGQMHGATLIDATGRALRPSILWNDTRSHAEAAELDAMPFMRQHTGNIVFPGFTAPKLNWVRKHEGDVFQKTRTVLLPKDFLRLWLIGEAVSDMSDAAGTSWLDVGRRDWSDEALAATHLSREHMPRLVEGSDVSGTLRAEIAREYGLSADVIVAGGGGDNAASAVGTGVTDEGDAFLSLGTSGVLFAANSAFRPNPGSAVHTFCHVLPGKWHQMGVILAATDALNWLSGILQQSPSDLTAQLGQGLRSPSSVRFLPYLGGERTPHNDAGIRGAFNGLSHGTDRTALTQSVLEGVAFAFRDCQNALRDAGTAIDRCLAVGGGSQSDYWLKLMATVLNLPLDLPARGELGGALGAARLAMIASGDLAESEACKRPKIERVVEPDPAMTDLFDQAYQDFRSIYPALSNR